MRQQKGIAGDTPVVITNEGEGAEQYGGDWNDDGSQGKDSVGGLTAGCPPKQCAEYREAENEALKRAAVGEDS